MNFRNPFPPGPAVPDPTIFPFSIPRTLDEPDDANRALPDENETFLRFLCLIRRRTCRKQKFLHHFAGKLAAALLSCDR